MSADYAFEVDPARDFVRLRMSGFFTAADIPDFLDAREAAHTVLTCAPNAHVTLNDIREMKIQSQEMVDAFGQVLAASGYHARRLAFVVSPGLLRPQVIRALASRDARCFASEADAEAWLFGVGEAVAA